MKIELQHTRVFKSLWQEQKRVNAFRGSARSSKTWSILQAVVYWLISGKFGARIIPRGNFSIVRETLPSLRASAYKDFIEILHECHFYDKVHHGKTALEFNFAGRNVSFFSTDDLNSAKLRGRQHTFFFIEESNTVSFEAFNQLIMRTEQFCILAYNPAGIENWCKTYIEGERFERGDVKLDVSTYHDNPFIPQEMKDEIEGLKYTDLDLYECYARGNWIKSRNNVFESVELIDFMPAEYDKRFFGLDFGWHDPSVCVEVRIWQNEIYINQVFYQSEMTHEAMVNALYIADVDRAYCDAADSRMINTLKRFGFRAKPAKKGADSIINGIRFLQRYKIFITRDSVETIEDFRKYKWIVDKDTLHPTDKPAPFHDHAPDAVRYAVSFAQRQKLRII